MSSVPHPPHLVLAAGQAGHNDCDNDRHKQHGPDDNAGDRPCCCRATEVAQLRGRLAAGGGRAGQ